MKTQIENLTRYILANPAENFTIVSETVLNAAGDTVARFNSHIEAIIAIRDIRDIRESLIG